MLCFIYSIYFHIVKFINTIIWSTAILLGSALLFPFPRKVRVSLFSFVGKAWGKTTLFLGGFRFEVKNDTKLDPDAHYVFAGNHQSSLDIYIYYAFIKHPFPWVAKRSLFRIPFLGWAMSAMGHIPVDREESSGATASLKNAIKKIKAGTSIAIFPEGTRSPDGKLLPMKKGAFFMARLSRMSIVPITINGAHLAAPKGNFIFKPSNKIKIHIHSPLDSKDKNVQEKFTKILEKDLGL